MKVTATFDGDKNLCYVFVMKKKKLSEYRKYSAKDGLWIPYRYVLYSYWWQFLKIAHEEKRDIDWKLYEEWGTPEQIFSQSFRTWWLKNWKRLFAISTAYTEGNRFVMSTRSPKTDAIKVALEVYKNKDRGDNRVIFEYLNKQYVGKMMSISYAGGKDTKEMNRTIKRYMAQAEKILDSVCVCQFP